MSVIFSDEELSVMEKKLGAEFISLYEKLWAERNNVKTYFQTVQRNVATTLGFKKQYWEYKREEIKSVIDNQSRWLRTVINQLEGVISDDAFSRLEVYLKKNEIKFDEQGLSRGDYCIKTNPTANCVCKKRAGHDGLCVCVLCKNTFTGEWSHENRKRGY